MVSFANYSTSGLLMDHGCLTGAVLSLVAMKRLRVVLEYNISTTKTNPPFTILLDANYTNPRDRGLNSKITRHRHVSCILQI